MPYCRKIPPGLILLILLAMACFALPAAAGAEQDIPSVQPSVTAEAADPDNPIAQGFVNMVNGTAPDAELVSEYPLDPHDLAEYGDSIRVRYLSEATGEDPSYLVYREDLYLIQQEEAAAYTITKSEDSLTAEITPALPDGALEGKTGIVLLGRSIGEDTILLFDGEPVRTENGLTVTLPAAEKVILNRIFSDGRFTTPMATSPAGGDNTARAKQVLSANRLSAGRSIPQVRGILPSIDISKDVDITNLSGTVSCDTSDFKLKVSFNVNPAKLDFGLNIKIDARVYFDLTSSGSVAMANLVELEVPLYSEDLFGVNLIYDVRASFNEVPVHVKGHIDNSVTYVFGVIGATLQNYKGPVTFVTAELVNPERDKNKDAYFTIGSQLSTSVDFLELSIDLFFYEIKIGPVFSVSFDLSADTHCTLRLNKDIPLSGNRTEEVIHECAIPGHAGCYTLKTTGDYIRKVTLKVNLYFKKWSFSPYSKGSDTGAKNYYNSLEHQTGFREGECPHLLYRIPVQVRNGTEDNWTPAGAGFRVSPALSMTDMDATLLAYSRDETDANGNAVIYMPYREAFRYMLVASNELNVAGFGTQPHDMRRGGNEKVIIYVNDLNTVSFLVKKDWEIDTDGQEMPAEQPVFVVQELNPDTNRWEIRVDDGKPLTITLEYSSREWSGTCRSQPMYRTRNGKTELREYRVRELSRYPAREAGESLEHYTARLEELVVYDRNDPEWSGQAGVPVVSFAIPAYVSSVTGKLVPAHQAQYTVRYETDYGYQGNMTVRVTNTAIRDIHVYKLWDNVPEEERPDHIYAALRSKPEEGWEKYAESVGVSSGWRTVTDPMSGPVLDLNQLVATGELDIEVARLKESRLAIAELTAENGWNAVYRVRKYENGIPMMWQAAELDGQIAGEAIEQMYGLVIEAQMIGKKSYTSIPGLAQPAGNGWELSAGIVNTKEKKGFTIGGVKYWPESSLGNAEIPESIDIVVIDADTGEEAGCVTVSGPRDTHTLQMWPWTLTGENLSPDGRYEIREELPAGLADKYSCEVRGYDLINTWVGDTPADIRVRKLWDPLYLKFIEKEHGEGYELPVNPEITLCTPDQEYVTELTADDGYVWVLPDITLTDPDEPMDPDRYSVSETGVPRTFLNSVRNSRFIPVYSGPELTFENGRRIYTFTVVNMLQFEYDVGNVRKYWDFGELSEPDAVIPDSVSIELLRNGEPIGEKVTTDRSFLYDYFGKLKQGASLNTYGLKGEAMMRLDPEGRLYKYSIRETMDPAELLLKEGQEPNTGGYVCALTTFSTWEDTVITYVLTNTWVPGKPAEELVTVRGTKRWKPEAWPASAAFRPDAVEVYILDSDDELAAVAECTYVYEDRAWTWSAENLPRYDENGEEIAYHIQEKHTDGYTAAYDTPVFDEQALTWTCDMENRLAFAYMNVFKRVRDGNPAPDDTFTFRMTFFGGFSDSDFGAPKLKSDTVEIRGEGEARFEFLLNGEGTFLYLLEEEYGGDPRYNYDTAVRGLFLVVKKDNSGELRGDFYLLDQNTAINAEDSFDEIVEQLPSGRNVGFTNRVQKVITVEKKWEIDQEGRDRPEGVEVAVQKKVPRSNPERWETVAIRRLTAENGWKAVIGVPRPEESNPAYRVRELSVDRTIVYAPGDADNPNPDDAGYVTLGVPEYESVVTGGRVEAHDTRYHVSYGTDGDTYTVTNTAVTEVDVIKRWLLLNEDEETPESAWVALLAKPESGAQQDAELPVIDLVSGGMSPEDLAGRLALGISADMFGNTDGLSLAIAEVNEENGWTAHFTSRKYSGGIPLEFIGAELNSEIIRQVIRQAAGYNLPVSYQSTGDYISVPGKAYRTFSAWGRAELDPAALEELSKAGREITDQDLEQFRMDDALLSEWKLAANVINVQIDPGYVPDPGPDPQPEPPDLTVVKRWENDQESNRPETLTIHVRQAEKNAEGVREEVAGSPFTLRRSDFEGRADWSKTLAGVDGTKEYEISEEYPDGFANRDHYLGEVVDNEIINTWSEEEITTVRVSGQKIWDDNDNKAKKRPKRITVELLADGRPATRPVQRNGSTVNEPVKAVETSEEGGWKYFFTDLPRYKTVDGEKKEIRYTVKEKAAEDYTVEYADPVFDDTARNWDCDITNRLNGYGEVTVEKKWDIDLEGKDHPKSIEVLIQKKTGDGDDEKWESVKLVELTEDNREGLYTWKTTVYLPLKQQKEGTEGETEDIVYRVRELEEENGILKTLKDKIKEYAGQVKDRFDEWMGDIKTNAKELFDNLPEPLKEAANEGFDELAEELDAKKNEVYEKLIEKMEFYSAEKRIVYDKDDKDKPEKKSEDSGDGDGDDDKDKEPETNIVSFKVEEYTSLTGEKVDAHETRYRVTYDTEEGEEGKGGTYSIGNQAITEVDVVKRWIMLGDADDEDKPDNVYLVLLFKVDSDIAEKAGGMGVDVSSYLNIELPVFNLFDNTLFTSGLISGGMNPITLISELTLGIDIDIFNIGDKVLTVAVAKVGEDDNWTAHFVTSKYMFGIPVEYKGAELGSEIIRQIVKYLLHVDLPVSYTPFGNYISIPGKAYGNLVDVSQISDLFNLDDSSIAGKLAGEALELVTGKLNDLLKEIAPAGTPIGLDDWEQVANVINIKIGIDIDWPETTYVRKVWVNDKEENRPDSITLRVKVTRKDGTEEDREITLKKEDFEGSDEWSVELNEWEKGREGDGSQNGEGGEGEEGEDEDENPITGAEITEEIFPDGFDSSIYEQKIDGDEATNILKVPGKVSVFGRKIWDDDDDRDRIRPEKLTVRLLANGVAKTKTVQRKNEETGEITEKTEDVTVEISAEGNWKYFFPDLPEKDGNGQPITYTVEEKEVPEGYTVSGGTKDDGYNLTNTHEPEKLDEVTVRKVWDDDGDRDGIRPDKVSVTLRANGATPTDLSPASPTDLTEADNWEYTYTGLYKYEDGEEIVYTADETEVPEGYEKSVDGLVITNTYEPERTDVTVTKIWDDGDDADGIRPEKVTVSLATPTDLSPLNLATPTDIGEEDGWEHTFTGMLKYHEGQEIHYLADEEEVPDGYTKTVDGLTVINTHEYEKVTITGRKVWDDDEDRDGIRPDKVTVILLANGEKVDEKTVTRPETPATPTDLNEEAWPFSFEDMPKNRKGNPIEYTVDEEAVPGYEKTVSGDPDSGFVITNRHVPDTISVSGEKIWDDADDQDGKRPDSIRIILIKDGEDWAMQDISAAQGWKYTFPNIEKNTDGTESLWSIMEIRPEEERGYEPPVYTDRTPAGEKKHFVIDVTNRRVPEETEVTVEKAWDDDNNRDGIRPDSVTLYLYADGNRVDGKEAVLNEGNEWQYTFTGLPKYAGGKEITYSASEDPVDGYTMAISGTRVTNTHVPETVTISGRKYWDDRDNHDGLRPEEITVILSANGREADRKTVTAADGWAYSFTVPKYEAGSEISYQVSEEAAEGYTMAISGYDITNTHVPERITVSGEKEWQDGQNQDGLRPESITISLYADGVRVYRRVIRPDGDGKWTYSFPNMLKYREGGGEIVYSVAEDTVSGYYFIPSGMNVTNIHVPETMTVSGEKFWDDDNDRDAIRPDEITVTLYADGMEPVSQTVTADEEGRWRYTFRNVPVYNNGNKLSWIISEEPVAGYRPVYSGWNITNVHVPEKTAVSVRKIWNDTYDQDGIRPDEVTVILLADGAEVQRASVTAESGWTYRFTGLDQMDGGTDIVYTVTEAPVPEGYTVSVDGYTVTNKHLPETVDISGEKTWDDDDDRDGIRPEGITVVLLADGAEARRKTVTAADGWKYSFTGLNKYKDGTEIVYTVAENPVPEGYTASVDGYDITNKHLPETADISGEKTWDDDGDRDGIRPEGITVVLLADGAEAQRKTVTAADGWKYSFANLDKYKDGAEIVYTVAENPVPEGYTAFVDGYDITNRHVPGTVSVSGRKTWDDDDDRDGIRPEGITVILLADGAEAQRKTVTAADGWRYSFANLDKYKDGAEIVYTVAENPVPEGYTASVDGYDITNRHLPETIRVSGEKIWEDGNDRDGIRPEGITVVLLADGKEEARTAVTWQDGWKYSFTGLDRYRDGAEVAWTVKEDPVPEGYTASVDGYVITNTHRPETVGISGRKIWNDDSNLAGIRPESVTVILLADGEEAQRRTVTAADGWEYSFTGLDRYRDAREISYTVDEIPVERYDTVIEGYDIVNTPKRAVYTVEWYYQKDGTYPETPNVAEERTAMPGTEVSVTDADRIPGRERYMPDERADNVFSGTVAADGSLRLKIYFHPYYIITFDPNGGLLEGSRKPVSTNHLYGEEITVREEPVYAGYEFLYWEGSQYNPGDTYTVTEDHTFTARWRKEPDPPGPYSYKFTFTKKWSGAHGDSIDWTLYDRNGNKVSKKFNKKVVSETEWRYEAWFESDEDYYIVEDVPKGFRARYENTGVRADETDCCYNGGTIINYRIPKTGDNTNLPLWITLSVLGLLSSGFMIRHIRRKRR